MWSLTVHSPTAGASRRTSGRCSRDRAWRSFAHRHAERRSCCRHELVAVRVLDVNLDEVAVGVLEACSLGGGSVHTRVTLSCSIASSRRTASGCACEYDSMPMMRGMSLHQQLARAGGEVERAIEPDQPPALGVRRVSGFWVVRPLGGHVDGRVEQHRLDQRTRRGDPDWSSSFVRWGTSPRRSTGARAPPRPPRSAWRSWWRTWVRGRRVARRAPASGPESAADRHDLRLAALVLRRPVDPASALHLVREWPWRPPRIGCSWRCREAR